MCLRWAYLLLVSTLAVGCRDEAPAPNGNGAAGAAAGTPAAMSGAGGGAGLSLPPTAAGAGAAGTDAGAPAAAGKLSFATDVYDAVIRKRCGNCHNDAPSFGGLAFFPTAATAYANLVGVPAGAEERYLCRASGLVRVQPGDPQASLIYLKLTNPPCGSKMPPLAFGTTTAQEVELVRKWIADGAAP